MNKNQTIDGIIGQEQGNYGSDKAGFMQKLGNALLSTYGKLATYTGLTIGAAGLLLAVDNGKVYGQDVQVAKNESGYTNLVNKSQFTLDELNAQLSNAKYLGEKRGDFFQSIPGDDTKIEIYQTDKYLIGLYQFDNGKIWRIASKEINTGKTKAYFSELNDGIYSLESEHSKINLAKY